MIDAGIAVVGGVFYLTGQYTLALLLIVLAIISGAGAASLLITKVIVIALLIWIARHVAEKGGYTCNAWIARIGNDTLYSRLRICNEWQGFVVRGHVQV
jgi:hypothetical protein